LEHSTTPSEYIKTEINILWQFLESNRHKFNTKIWGISAQGGDLEKKADALREVYPPTDRIEVVSSSGEISKDITLPILEAIGEFDE